MTGLLEGIGGGILMLAILAVSIWVGMREQGFLKNIARRSRERATEQMTDVLMQQEMEKRKQR